MPRDGPIPACSLVAGRNPLQCRYHSLFKDVQLAAKIMRWVTFGAGVFMLPLLMAWLILVLTLPPRGTAGGATLEKVIGNGELLVVIWVLSASAIGELFGSSGDRRLAKIISGGATFVIILIATGMFCWVTEAWAANQAYDAVMLVNGSIVLFILSLISCLGCLLSVGRE